MEVLFTVFILLLIPSLVKKFEYFKLIKIFSPIAICYFLGFVLSQMPLPFQTDIIKNISEGSIALSISLLVLNSQLSRFREMLAPVLKTFLLGILSLLITLFITFFLFAKFHPEGPGILGMLTGVYVGGTPNLFAIGVALELDNETIALVNTSEILFGGIYFLLLITIVKPFLLLFLKKYRTHEFLIQEDENIQVYSWKEIFKYSVQGILLALLITLISIGIISLLFVKMQVAGVLLLITTISILAAQSRYVKSLHLKFEIADFLLLIFSFGIGLQVDFVKMFETGSDIYILSGSVFLGTVLIHYLLALLTKTDADTLIISSTAALYGPAFIGPVAKAIKNKELIFYGITLGLLGYILGNYLGIGLAWLFEWLV